MKNSHKNNNFGSRVAALRKDRGMTQADLADKLGISRRMVAYYEKQSEHVPANLLVPLSKAFKVSLDELLDIKSAKLSTDKNQAALRRRLKKIESLPKSDQKALFHYLDALIKKNTA